ncbi:hypothetical protein AB0C65_35585 [Nocardia sp. NPDC048505]|uniref:hypothetical protein n=1 Tax=Nocardia sp. NPDC048505 TaxID=3155756 RepID=UPI0033C94F9F
MTSEQDRPPDPAWLRAVSPSADPAAEHLRGLILRARRAGYQMAEKPRGSGHWVLLDLDDNSQIAGGDLDSIQDWLES